MPRLPDIADSELTPEQKRVKSEISSAHLRDGTVHGPFPIWLRIPEFADFGNRFLNSIRVHGKLDKRLHELAVIIVARDWTAQFVWFAHARQGIRAGLSQDVVDAIKNRQVPKFTREDEQLVYDVMTELIKTRELSQSTYEKAMNVLGVDLLIELITGAGFYTMISMLVNTFDSTEGQHPLD